MGVAVARIGQDKGVASARIGQDKGVADARIGQEKAAASDLIAQIRRDTVKREDALRRKEYFDELKRHRDDEALRKERERYHSFEEGNIERMPAYAYAYARDGTRSLDDVITDDLDDFYGDTHFDEDHHLGNRKKMDRTSFQPL